MALRLRFSDRHPRLSARRPPIDIVSISRQRAVKQQFQYKLFKLTLRCTGFIFVLLQKRFKIKEQIFYQLFFFLIFFFLYSTHILIEYIKMRKIIHGQQLSTCPYMDTYVPLELC